MIILSVPNFQRALFKYNERAHIPNQVGFRFVALLYDGLEVVAEVGKDAQGMHVIKGIPINTVKGWRNITEADEQAITCQCGRASPALRQQVEPRQ